MKTSVWEVLNIRPFLFLWLSEIFSQIAMNMINFVLIIVVFELTKSNTAVAGVVLAYTIPAIIFGVLAGVLVDYWSKKRVLLITNIIRMVLLILLAFHHTNIYAVFFLSFVISIATQFFIPAETPMIPLLVPKKYLFAANAFFGIGVYGSALVAYALSGPLLILYGKTTVFFILASFFALATVCVHMIMPPKTYKEILRKHVSIRSGIRDAILVIFKNKHIMHSLFLLVMSQIIILVLGVVGPSYSQTILHRGVEQFPLIFITPAALGMVVGALLLIRFLSHHPHVILANIGVFLSGILIIILPYAGGITRLLNTFSSWFHLPLYVHADILHIVVVLAFSLGFTNALVFVPSNTMVQEETHHSIRGKIYGVLNAVIGVCSLLPVVLAGTLTDAYGVFHVLQGIGIIIIAIGCWRLVVLEVKKQLS